MNNDKLQKELAKTLRDLKKEEATLIDMITDYNVKLNIIQIQIESLEKKFEEYFIKK